MSTPTPPPEGIPRFFLDRDLGRVAVPNGLRAHGIDVITLSERYGVQAGEGIPDTVWMPDAAAAGDAALMADAAIRRKNAQERRVLVDCGLRAFVVNGQLPAQATIERFITNLVAIERACRRPGPFVYRLHPERIQPLRIPGR